MKISKNKKEYYHQKLMKCKLYKNKLRLMKMEIKLQQQLLFRKLLKVSRKSFIKLLSKIMENLIAFNKLFFFKGRSKSPLSSKIIKLMAMVNNY